MEQIPLPPAPSFTDSFVNVFATPGDAFQGLKNTAPAPMLWIIPFIVTILVTIGSMFIIHNNETLSAEARELQSKMIQKMVNEGKLPADKAEAAEQQADSPFARAMQFVGGAIVCALFYFGGALFLWLANKAVLKTTAGYEKHLELYSIASWTGILGGIITIGMMIGVGSLNASPSAALVVLGNYDGTLILHKLLSAINIFSLWQTLVIGIGLSKFSDKPVGQGFAVAFVLWLLWVAFTLGLSIIFQ